MRQDNQNHQLKAPQTEEQSVRHQVQQNLPQKEFQKRVLSVQAPSSSNNDTVATAAHQVMTELSEAVSQKE
jgi:hypothetical protein